MGLHDRFLSYDDNGCSTGMSYKGAGVGAIHSGILVVLYSIKHFITLINECFDDKSMGLKSQMYKIDKF